MNELACIFRPRRYISLKTCIGLAFDVRYKVLAFQPLRRDFRAPKLQSEAERGTARHSKPEQAKRWTEFTDLDSSDKYQVRYDSGLSGLHAFPDVVKPPRVPTGFITESQYRVSENQYRCWHVQMYFVQISKHLIRTKYISVPCPVQGNTS